LNCWDCIEKWKALSQNTTWQPSICQKTWIVLIIELIAVHVGDIGFLNSGRPLMQGGQYMLVMRFCQPPSLLLSSLRSHLKKHCLVFSLQRAAYTQSIFLSSLEKHLPSYLADISFDRYTNPQKSSLYWGDQPSYTLGHEKDRHVIQWKRWKDTFEEDRRFLPCLAAILLCN